MIVVDHHNKLEHNDEKETSVLRDRIRFNWIICWSHEYGQDVDKSNYYKF